MLDTESINDMRDIVNLSCNLDKYDLIPDVSSDTELEKHLVELGYLQIPSDLLPNLYFDKMFSIIGWEPKPLRLYDSD